MKEVYRPSFIEPDLMSELGYKLVADKDGYLKYTSSWDLKAKHREDRKYEQLLGDDKRIIYFNLTYSPEENLLFCQIREDGDTRTVYNGVIFDRDQLIMILKLVE